MRPHDPPRLVLCEDDPIIRGWLLRLAADTDVEVVAATARWAEALELVVQHEADAVVVDLATVGRVGLRLVRALRRLAPECAVFVLSPFKAIEPLIRDSGAAAVAPPTDLRPLAVALRGLERPIVAG